MSPSATTTINEPLRLVSAVVSGIVEVIEQGLRAGDQQHADRLSEERRARRHPLRVVPQPWPERPEHERTGPDVDRGQDGDQAREVEPGGHPAPAASAQDGGPVIQAAGGGEGRRDLSQRDRHDEREQRDQRPPQTDRRPADATETEVERGDAARQDADRGHRDRKVGRTRPSAAAAPGHSPGGSASSHRRRCVRTRSSRFFMQGPPEKSAVVIRSQDPRRAVFLEHSGDLLLLLGRNG